ncbi:predicted protein [Plenodomus lingam JN3]|uniref:Predicted protein n=1 Tax=Leptosphaeria maculans (strain JN3 / isolate v23.1.3 / race Av1-4-5-6-7-8) TaxID=985895 RepID=E4ZST7_LEPMJ|nr:predicted protein [Plenodomus lingam JN3]CBX94525.1 predicted protein [Plenodomus lingam JN3]
MVFTYRNTSWTYRARPAIPTLWVMCPVYLPDGTVVPVTCAASQVRTSRNSQSQSQFPRNTVQFILLKSEMPSKASEYVTRCVCRTQKSCDHTPVRQRTT